MRLFCLLIVSILFEFAPATSLHANMLTEEGLYEKPGEVSARPQNVRSIRTIWKEQFQSRLEDMPQANKKRLSKRIFAFSSSSFAIGLSSGLLFSSDEYIYYSPTLVYIGVGLMALAILGLVVGGIIAIGEWFGRKFKKKNKQVEEPVMEESP